MAETVTLEDVLLEDATLEECDIALQAISTSLGPLQLHADRRTKYRYADRVLDRRLHVTQVGP